MGMGGLRSLLAIGVAAAANVTIPTVEIADGVHMPTVSIGTWKSARGLDAYDIVSKWLSIGGRGIDTALIYMDQARVAAAIKDAGLKREDVFITSKIPVCTMDPYLTKLAVERDLKDLGTSYIDLMLIHSPLGDDCQGTWKVLESFAQNGTLKAIGVSNFGANRFHQLQKLCHPDGCKIPPAVNQIDYSVNKHDEHTIAWCREHNITVEAYSPLGGTHGTRSVFSNPTVKRIATAHNVSAAKVALRWIVQRGDVLTVLSESIEHQLDDAQLFDFVLEDAEMAELDAAQADEEPQPGEAASVQ